MNKRHLEVLASPRWREMLEQHLLPWVEQVADLGDDVLEVGPGRGLTTDLLRVRTARLTAIEIDPVLASDLAARLGGSNVEVVQGDARHTGFAGDRFSAVACFGVLHHVESPGAQDEVFREILRVLRPAGVLVASDGYDNDGTREAHVDDLFVPIDPDRVVDRLSAMGFCDVAVDRGEYEFRFRAAKPAGPGAVGGAG